MEDILMMLPTIFAYWAGILISWSAVTAAGLIKIIYTIKQQNLPVRDSDITALVVSCIGGLMFFISLFIMCDITTLIIDALVIASFWYTVVLGYITGANLSGLPSIIISGKVRSKHKSAGTLHTTTE